MYVRDTARGQGIANALLARIGFRECPAFGDYAFKPPEAIASSGFFEKRFGV